MGNTRKKKLIKSVISIKKQIEVHFEKLKDDLKNENFESANYHAKEIDRSLIDSLKKRLKMLDINDEIVKRYEKRLKKLMESYGVGKIV